MTKQRRWEDWLLQRTHYFVIGFFVLIFVGLWIEERGLPWL